MRHRDNRIDKGLKDERKVVEREKGSVKERKERDGEIVGSEMTMRQKQHWHKGWFTLAVSFQGKVSPGIKVAPVTHPDYKVPHQRGFMYS